MKYNKVPSITESLKKAALSEARSMSALPAMRFMSGVTPSRRSTVNGNRKPNREADKKSVGEIDWNNFSPSNGRTRGLDILSKKESYLAPSEPELVFDPVLDDNPGASAAYSLRQLYLNESIEYTLVTVRRGGDDVEQSFTQSQIEGGVLESFCNQGDGYGYVSQWYSQEINEKHLIQTSSVSQPTIVKNGELVRSNGVPAIYFDGVDDYMDYGGSIVVKDFYVIANWLGGGPTMPFYNGLLSSISGLTFITAGNNTTRFLQAATSFYINGVNDNQFAPLSESKVVRYKQTFVYNSPNFRVGVDRTNLFSRMWHGNISEILIYPTDAENSDALISNLASRNNIQF